MLEVKLMTKSCSLGGVPLPGLNTAVGKGYRLRCEVAKHLEDSKRDFVRLEGYINGTANQQRVFMYVQ